MKVLYEYMKYNWVIYSLLFMYGLSILLNASGVHVWLPTCLITHYTGYECFGCGINQAVIALLSGDVKSAASFNPMIIIYLPAIFCWIVYDIYIFFLKTNPPTYEKH